MRMSFWFVVAILICLGLLLGSFVVARRIKPAFRSYLYWSAVFFAIALISNVVGFFFGLGNLGAREFFNATPFIIFVNLFFPGPGVVLALMGIWDSQANPDKASLYN